MDSVSQPGIDGIDAPFVPSIVDKFQVGTTTANPITVDDEEDKENSARTTTTTTPKSELPAETLRSLKSPPFRTRLENVPDSVYRTLFR